MTQYLLILSLSKDLLRESISFIFYSKCQNNNDLNKIKYLCDFLQSECKQSQTNMVALSSSTHSFHIITKTTAPSPAIKLLHQHSRESEARKKKCTAYSFPLRTPPQSFTHYFQSHPIGQNLVTWSHLAIREVGNVICAWQPCVHLTFDGSILKGRRNWHSLPPQLYSIRWCYCR